MHEVTHTGVFLPNLILGSDSSSILKISRCLYIYIELINLFVMWRQNSPNSFWLDLKVNPSDGRRKRIIKEWGLQFEYLAVAAYFIYLHGRQIWTSASAIPTYHLYLFPFPNALSTYSLFFPIRDNHHIVWVIISFKLLTIDNIYNKNWETGEITRIQASNSMVRFYNFHEFLFSFFGQNIYEFLSYDMNNLSLIVSGRT